MAIFLIPYVALRSTANVIFKRVDPRIYSWYLCGVGSIYYRGWLNMHMLLLFGILSIHHPDYKSAFDISKGAVYQGSDIKLYANTLEEKFRTMYPEVATVGGLGYTVFVKKQVKFTSRKIALPGSTTSYAYDHISQSGSISINWNW